MIVFALLLVLFYLAYRFMVRRRDFLTTCQSLMDRLPNDLYESVAPFAETNGDFQDSEFWRQSRKISGVFDRIRIAVILRQLVQAHYFAGRITKAQARRVWRFLCLQMWFSIFAIPEAGVCLLIEGCPHIAALAAIKFYGAVVIRSHNLFEIGDTPECMLRIPDLL